MIWSAYTALGADTCQRAGVPVDFEDSAWKIFIDECVKTQINTVFLELVNKVHYGSHPELSRLDSWTRERVKGEVKNLKDKGITLIPALNFSACHHSWLGDYRRMMGLPEYYRVCRELIYEVYDLFDRPKYIHLGMDEEGDPQFFHRFDLVAYRQGELLWHDLQFLCDCVRDKGAIPWIWGDLCMEHPKEFKERVKPGSVVLSPWNYRGLKPEHYTPIASDPKYVEKYSKEPYKSMNMTWVEQDPLCVRYMNESVPAAQDGYDIVPCASICFGCEYNQSDVVEYFSKNAPAEHLAGFMVAPWRRMTADNIEEIKKNLRLFKEARDKFIK